MGQGDVRIWDENTSSIQLEPFCFFLVTIDACENEGQLIVLQVVRKQETFETLKG